MAFEVQLDIDGIQKLRAKMETLSRAMQTQVYNQLHSIGSDIKAEAMRLAPVRTGRLRSSIFSRVTDWLLEVGATAPYARYVEFGTRFMAARRFLWRAVQQFLPALRRLLDQAVDLAIEEAAGS